MGLDGFTSCGRTPMGTVPKKMRRHPGQLVVEQTEDAKIIETVVSTAGLAIADITPKVECFLVAFCGDYPVGIAGLATQLDVGFLLLLFVTEKMRGRGVGTSLLLAVRQAAQARGAQRLYAAVPRRLVTYFYRLGFAPASQSELVEAFSLTPISQRRRLVTQECSVVSIDLSAQGLAER
jgi:N-acetylglutamate synthase-like GNAT family acetyltransferase